MNEKEEIAAEKALRASLNGAAPALDNLLNPGLVGAQRKTGFILLAWPFGTGFRRVLHISNTDANSIRKTLEEVARNMGKKGFLLGPRD